MSKAITSGQARNMIASFVNDTPWEEVDVDLQPFIELPPKERGERFAHFLKFGCAVAGQPSKSVLEPVLDFIVRVDRSVKPIYPDWFRELEHPELEGSGPSEYNLQDEVEQWLHDDQKRGFGSVVGNTIYGHLQKGDALATCLNLQDGIAIQAKGIAVFRKLFGGKGIFLWGSVVRNRIGNLDVPFLCEDGDGVVVDWHWLANVWDSNNPALRFSK